MATVRDVVLKEMRARAVPDAVLGRYQELFQALGVFSSDAEWLEFLDHPDDLGVSAAPRLAEWLHFIQAEMYKLVGALFVRQSAVDEDGFSTGLATSFMSTLSRPACPTLLAKYVKNADAEQALRLLTEGIFYAIFDAVLVLSFFYHRASSCFSALLELCRTAVGLDKRWDDVLKLLRFFFPDQKVAGLSVRQRVQKLLEGLAQHDVRLSTKVRWLTVTKLVAAGETALEAVEGATDGNAFVEVPLEVLLDHEKDVEELVVTVAVADHEERVHHFSAPSQALYSVVIEAGQRIHAAAEETRKKKKKAVVIRLPSNPQGSSQMRHAFNVLKSVLKGNVKGSDICPSHEKLRDSGGWLSARQVKEYVEREARMHPIPYTLDDRPEWVQEMVAHHDLVGRFQVEVRDDDVYVRATHGHQGEAKDLYRAILMAEEQRLDGGSGMTAWYYLDKKSVEAAVEMMKSKNGLLCYLKDGVRFLLRETVEQCQRYRSEFEEWEQFDADFGTGAQSPKQQQKAVHGCFLEVDLDQVAVNYTLYRDPTGKAIYGFNSDATALHISKGCFTGIVWEFGAAAPVEHSDLAAFCNVGVPPTAPTRQTKGVLVTEQDSTATAAMDEEERHVVLKVEALLQSTEKVCEVTLSKGGMNRNTRLRQLKLWIREQGLECTEDASNTTFSILRITKPVVLTDNHLAALKEFLHLPEAFPMDLLRRACTASQDNRANYEELEFIGDAVLGCVVAVDAFRVLIQTGEGSLQGLSKSVVSEMCSNQILAHLLPLCLMEPLEMRGEKTRADVVEALIGAAFMESDTPGAAPVIAALFQQLPSRIGSAQLDETIKSTLTKAWEMCPYRPELSLPLLRAATEIERALARLTAASRMTQMAGADKSTHAAMVGFCRIQMKTYSTHFTSGDVVFCYRRIFPEDTQEVENRIVCGAAAGQMTYVNEFISERLRFVIDYDAANIFSWNFFTFLTRWAVKRALACDREGGPFIVASSCGREKDSYHIHFPRWVIHIDEYAGIVKDLAAYVFKKQKALICRLRAAYVSADGNVTPLCAVEIYLPNGGGWGAKQGWSLAQVAQLYGVPFRCVLLDAVTHDVASCVVAEFRSAQSETPTRWILGRTVYDCLPQFLSLQRNGEVSFATEMEAKAPNADPHEKALWSYLDVGVGGSRKLRMVFCDKFDVRVGRVGRPVYPYLYCSPEGASPSLLEIQKPASDGQSSDVAWLPPTAVPANAEAASAAVPEGPTAVPANAEAASAAAFGPPPLEPWDPAFSPAELRRRGAGTALFLSCMDAVTLTTLREPVLRDVVGLPYSPWWGDAQQQQQQQPGEAVNLARWRMPQDTLPSFLRDPATPTPFVMQASVTLESWRNLYKTDDELSMPLRSVAAPLDLDDGVDKAPPKPRPLVESLLVHDTAAGELQLVLGGEVCLRQPCAGGAEGRERALQALLPRAVAFLTPHYALLPQIFEEKMVKEMASRPTFVLSLGKQPVMAESSLPPTDVQVVAWPLEPLSTWEDYAEAVVQHNLQHPGAHLLVLEEEDECCALQLGRHAAVLRSLFPYVWCRSEVAQKLRWLHLHEFRKVFVATTRTDHVTALLRLLRTHRSAGLRHCEVWHTMRSVKCEHLSTITTINTNSTYMYISKCETPAPPHIRAGSLDGTCVQVSFEVHRESDEVPLCGGTSCSLLGAAQPTAHASGTSSAAAAVATSQDAGDSSAIPRGAIPSSLPQLLPFYTAAGGEMSCVNGGWLVEGREEEGAPRCACPLSYTGPSCSDRQCPNSIGGKGDHRIRPVNPDTKFCDHCDTDLFQGLNCQLCQTHSACRAAADAAGTQELKCNRQFVIQGNEKQFQCRLDAPYFVNLMGDGRDISAHIMINWSTTDGLPFGMHDNGLSHFALYRSEPNETYLDPFFRCEAQQCAYHLSEDLQPAGAGAGTGEAAHRFFHGVKIAGRVLLVFLCLALAALSACQPLLGPKRFRKVTAGLSSIIVVITVVYIALMVLSIRPTHAEKKVVFECQHTSCSCAEDPPSAYHPICSESDVLARAILPSIHNRIRLICNPKSNGCTLHLDDLNLVFDAACEASECVDEAVFPDHPGEQPPDTRRLTILRVLAYISTLSVIVLVFHATVLHLQSRRRREAFAIIFHLPSRERQPHLSGTASPSATRRAAAAAQQAQDDAPDDDHLLGMDDADVRGGGGGVTTIEIPTDTSPRGALLADDDEGSVMEPAERAAVEATRRECRSALVLEAARLRYTLPPSRFAEEDDVEERRILQNISFSATSGDVLAIMGPSGAGKSTLLDLISTRGKSGVVGGELRINGTTITGLASRSHAGGAAAPGSRGGTQRKRQYRHLIGYVSQEETLLPALTVRQTISYAARLKLPSVFSAEMIRDIVDHTIAALKLERCAETLVGDGSSIRGVSGGERRRVSIAVELLANPRILLLDEPTSGLDSVSAQTVMEAIVTVAKDSPMKAYAPYYFAFKPIVIFSIHQPSTSIYQMFDKVLLLSRGYSVYSGVASEAVPLLVRRMNESFGYDRCDLRRLQYNHANPAELLLRLEDEMDDGVRLWLQQYGTGDSQTAVADPVREVFAHPPPETSRGAAVEGTTAGAADAPAVQPMVNGEELLASTTMLRKFYANIYQQLDILISRSCASLLGSFHLIACHAAVVACLSVLLCAVYKDQSLDLPGALNRAGCMTFLLLVTSFLSLSSLEALIVERRLFLEERENGFYTAFPYLVSRLVVDLLPFRVIPAVVLSAIIYFPMGFRVDDGWCFLYFICIMALFSVDITLVTMCIGILCETFGSAALLSSVVILWNFVFGGAMVQAGTLSPWLQTVQRFSPFFLSFEALMVNELDGQTCTFSPTDETGHPSSASFTVQCRQYLANEGLSPARWTEDIIQLCLYSVFLVLLASLLLSYWTKLVR
eukprot:gene6523-4700_t